MRIIIRVIFFALWFALTIALSAKPIALVGGRLIDGFGGTPIANSVILIGMGEQTRREPDGDYSGCDLLAGGNDESRQGLRFSQ